MMRDSKKRTSYKQTSRAVQREAIEAGGANLPVLQHAVDVSHVLLSSLLDQAEGGAAGHQQGLHRGWQAHQPPWPPCLYLRRRKPANVMLQR